MKHTIIFFVLILMGTAVWAQDVDPTKRDISLRVFNKKGRPLKGIVAQSVNTNKAGITDRQGLVVFREMSDSDSLSVMLSKYGETIFPVAGMDSIVIMLRSARLYSYTNPEGQSVYIERDQNNARTNTLIDVPALLSQGTYNSLGDLLRGRVAGLTISSSDSETANIRGTNSLTGSNQPLVVLDGRPVGTISDANAIVDVHSVKTIEILKSAPEWGTRGGNGVILVVSKGG